MVIVATQLFLILRWSVDGGKTYIEENIPIPFFATSDFGSSPSDPPPLKLGKYSLNSGISIRFDIIPGSNGSG